MVCQSTRLKFILLTLVYCYVSVFGGPVYYKVDDSYLPSRITRKRGYWVSIYEHVGHNMTFKILTYDTQKIIFCSNLRSSEEHMESNFRLDHICGEPYPFVKSLPNIYKKSLSRLDDSLRNC